MVDAPITCKLLSHSMACHPPSVSKKKKISETGPNWAEDKSAEFCQSCGFQFNVLIRRHHCRHCGLLFCRYCAQDRWPLPKYEYLHPVRVCRKCSRLCWKAEALVQAISNNDINSLSKYVQRKNDCNLHTGIFPPLMVAATQGFSEICRIILSGGGKVNYSVPAPQKTTLVTCSFCTFTDAFIPSSKNAYECQRCHEITHTIADTDKAAAFKGAAPSDHIGMTALHAAVRFKGHVDVVRALITNGADLNARTHNGNTAMHLAAANGHVDCCKLLLRRNADVNIVCDFDGDMVFLCSRWCAPVACAYVCLCAQAVCVCLVCMLVFMHAHDDGDETRVIFRWPNPAPSKKMESLFFMLRLNEIHLQALHRAVREGHAEIVSLLLLSGARKDHRLT